MGSSRVDPGPERKLGSPQWGAPEDEPCPAAWGGGASIIHADKRPAAPEPLGKPSLPRLSTTQPSASGPAGVGGGAALRPWRRSLLPPCGSPGRPPKARAPGGVAAPLHGPRGALRPCAGQLSARRPGISWWPLTNLQTTVSSFWARPSCTAGRHTWGVGLAPSSAHFLHGTKGLRVSGSPLSTCVSSCSDGPAPGGQGSPVAARGSSRQEKMTPRLEGRQT